MKLPLSFTSNVSNAVARLSLFSSCHVTTGMKWTRLILDVARWKLFVSRRQRFELTDVPNVAHCRVWLWLLCHIGLQLRDALDLLFSTDAWKPPPPECCLLPDEGYLASSLFLTLQYERKRTFKCYECHGGFVLRESCNNLGPSTDALKGSMEFFKHLKMMEMITVRDYKMHVGGKNSCFHLPTLK